MRQERLLMRPDYAHQSLIPYLAETERTLRRALQDIDGASECQIVPLPDMGFPNNVARLAGGFPTGCLVDWSCQVPFIPVDVTLNIDTSSIFYLEADLDPVLFETRLEGLVTSLARDGTYAWNFDKGNHFIVVGRVRESGQQVLVLHSNEKEFMYQYDGLCPTPNNWFSDAIATYSDGGRYVRYITGEHAIQYFEMADMLRSFNIVRHRFVAQHLVGFGTDVIVRDHHMHHYFMPSSQTVAVGCFVAHEGDLVPVFSRPGQDIDLVRLGAGVDNTVRLLDNNEMRLLFPHGWGKTSISKLQITPDREGGVLHVGNSAYPIEPGLSMGGDIQFVQRDFAPNAGDPDSLYANISHWGTGEVLESIEQEQSYSRRGLVLHGVRKHR